MLPLLEDILLLVQPVSQIPVAATLDETATLTGFVGVNALVEAPAFCIFQPRRRSKHGVGRGDDSGQPSSGLCMLCLQRRRGRMRVQIQRNIQARRVDTWFHSRRHARLHCGLGLMPAHITSQLQPVKACHLRPPFFQLNPGHTYSTTVRLSAPHPVHDAHGRTLLILRGTRMDPACWQPEKGCPAVGLTWVCWQS
ncbi:hypothetical protein HDV63DRAFT_363272 [Trichoderma sp. SZMC 28014]